MEIFLLSIVLTFIFIMIFQSVIAIFNRDEFETKKLVLEEKYIAKIIKKEVKENTNGLKYLGLTSPMLMPLLFSKNTKSFFLYTESNEKIEVSEKVYNYIKLKKYQIVKNTFEVTSSRTKWYQKPIIMNLFFGEIDLSYRTKDTIFNEID